MTIIYIYIYIDREGMRETVAGTAKKRKMINVGARGQTHTQIHTYISLNLQSFRVELQYLKDSDISS